MTEGISNLCQWCERPFRARRGGSPQRFCSAKHRSLFWSTLRRWGARAVAAGILTIADIRNGDPAACTLPGGPVSRPLVAEEQDDFGKGLKCRGCRITYSGPRRYHQIALRRSSNRGRCSHGRSW